MSACLLPRLFVSTFTRIHSLEWHNSTITETFPSTFHIHDSARATDKTYVYLRQALTFYIKTLREAAALTLVEYPLARTIAWPDDNNIEGQHLVEINRGHIVRSKYIADGLSGLHLFIVCVTKRRGKFASSQPISFSGAYISLAAWNGLQCAMRHSGVLR